MSYENIEQLPSEITENMPQGAQQIFLAAYKAASSDGINEEGAIQVAWSSVKNSYEQREDGKWYHKEDPGNFNPRGNANMGGG
jgi:cation transport regulator